MPPDATDHDPLEKPDDAPDAIRPHTPEEAEIYAQVIARVRRFMRAVTIARIGIIALMFAIVWRFWGPGAG